MTARDLLPGVYEVLLEAAYDISDSVVAIRDIDEGITYQQTTKHGQSRRTREANKIRRRRERAKNDVTEALEAAGRPDLVDPFLAFMDKYLSRYRAGRLIEELFNTDQKEVRRWT